MKSVSICLLALVCICICEAQNFVCAERDSPNTVAGMNVTEICFYDFYNKSVAEFKFYNAEKIQIPVNALDRTLIPAKKAHYDFETTGITNTSLTSFPEFAIYGNNSELDVWISIKQDPNAMPMVVKLSNAKVSEFFSTDVDELKSKLKSLTIPQILNMTEYAYAFNGSGWAKVRFNETTKRMEVIEKKGSFTVGGNLTETIRINSISLSSFRLNNSSISAGLPEGLRRMAPGYYAVIAVSVDGYGNPTFKLFAPFVVISGEPPSFSSSVAKGDDLALSYGYEFNMSFALLLKNVKYNAKAEVNLTKEIVKSLKLNLSYDNRQLKEVKLMDMSIGVYAPEGMFSYAYETESDSLSISTADLEPGEYVLYIVAFGDNLEPYYLGCSTVSILTPTPAPTPTPTTPTPTPTPIPTTPRPPPVGGGGGGGGYIPGTGVYYTARELVKAGESYEIAMPQSVFIETGVLSITVTPREDTTVQLRVERLKELPPGIPRPEGLAVLILSIEPRMGFETSLSGKIKFGVSIEEIKAKGFDPNLVTVILMRWDGSRWTELPTKFLSSDGKYNYYEAETPGFSYFVAVIKPVETPVPTTPVLTPTPTPTTPKPTPTPTPAPDYTGIAIAIVVVVAVLIAVAYLLKRR